MVGFERLYKDGKLYVILSAENIHPGKGTPVSQIDMRRISDGVKVSERWKTTDQVERAMVDEREYDFLYQDGEGFHFMNPENYDQLIASEDIIGDAAPYLTDGCIVTLSTHNGTHMDAPWHYHSTTDGGTRPARTALTSAV